MRRQPLSNTAPIALIGAVVIVGIVLASPVPASPDGAEWETVADPEGCQSCHLGSPDPTNSGALTIEGLPKVPEARHRYELTIMLEDPELENAGFMLSITSDAAAKGELAAIDERTETHGAMARSTYDGTTPAVAGKASWTLVWTAPASVEAAFSFDLWANAGNWDLSPLGDHLHHRVWNLAPAP